MTTLLWFLLGITLTLSIVLAVIVFTGGDSDTAGTTIATSTSDATTTTAVATTATTTTAPTTTTEAVTTTLPPCAGLPSATIPVIPGPGVSYFDGDFDGDGTADRFIGYQAGDGTFRVQIALSYGYATEMEVFGPAIAYFAQPFATGDTAIGLAAVDSGASTEIVQFFQLEGCAITKSTTDGTFEASFLRGGSVTHMDGMTCSAEGFTTSAATTGDGITWEYTTTDYLWDPVGRTFMNTGAASSTLTSPGDDDVIFSAALFNCPFAP